MAKEVKRRSGKPTSKASGGHSPKVADTAAAAIAPVEISFDPRNANRHDERSIETVYQSVAQLGAGRSIVVDRDGTVIGGEATLKAAQQLGLPLLPVRTQGDALVVVIREDLAADDPKRTALALADNKTASLSHFDETGLKELLAEIREVDETLLTATAFDMGELEALFDVQIEPEGTAAERHVISCTAEQYEVVEQAVAAVRRLQNDPHMKAGRAVELICGDFLAGATREALT